MHSVNMSRSTKATQLSFSIAGVPAGRNGGAHRAAARRKTISGGSVAAFAFLVVFGSIVAFTAYGWLLRSGTPSVLVSTYAYVNPAVAVLLGWTFAGEAVGGRELAAGAIVVASVGMLVLARHAPHEDAEPTPETVGPYLRRKEAQDRPVQPVPRLADLRRMAP